MNNISPQKNQLIIILITLFLVYFQPLSGIASGDEPRQSYLILYAFEQEGELLTQEMNVEKTDTILGRVVYIGSLSDQNIILTESGIGMTNAAMISQKMIDIYNPKGIIFSGIAGAIDSSVDIGDIVICKEWITHDYGYHGADGLDPRGIDIYSPENGREIEIKKLEVDSLLFVRAERIGSARIELNNIGGRKPKLHIGGTGVSGNAFIDNVEKRIWLSKEFNALTVDMESAAVAQVSLVNDIPFIIFRSASDLAGGSGSESANIEIKEFFKVAAANSARVVLRFLKEL